jgi:hypothetical protein
MTYSTKLFSFLFHFPFFGALFLLRQLILSEQEWRISRFHSYRAVWVAKKSSVSTFQQTAQFSSTSLAFGSCLLRISAVIYYPEYFYSFPWFLGTVPSRTRFTSRHVPSPVVLITSSHCVFFSSRTSMD